MPLNFSIVDRFVSTYSEALQDKTLLRHERYDILQKLREKLWEAMRDSERFEVELSRALDVIDTTDDYEELRRHHEQSVEGVRNYFQEEQTIVDVYDLFRVVRDHLTIRALRLVEKEMEREGRGPVPSRYCWIGLGSEGRDEQTFVTDQDNMLIYDAAQADLRGYYGEFAQRVVDRLDEIGFEKCKGGIMPSNEKWLGSAADWKKKIEETLSEAKGTLEFLDLIIMTDARVIYGDEQLFQTVLDEFFTRLKENRQVMKDITESSVQMSTALGFFGKFKVEAEGKYKGMFNMKLLGWSPLVMSVRALALHEGLHETNTLKRIKRLRAMNMIKKEMQQDLIQAYLLFAQFRIVNQIAALEKRDGYNYVDPAALDADEAAKVRKAMRTVESFQKYIHEVILFGQPF